MLTSDKMCPCLESKNCAAFLSDAEEFRNVYAVYTPDLLYGIFKLNYTTEEIYNNVSKNGSSPEYFCSVLLDFVKQLMDPYSKITIADILSLESDDDLKTKSAFYLRKGLKNIVILDLKDYNYDEYYVASEILKYKLAKIYPYMDTVDGLILKIKVERKANIMLFFSGDNLEIFERSFVTKQIPLITDKFVDRRIK